MSDVVLGDGCTSEVGRVGGTPRSMYLSSSPGRRPPPFHVAFPLGFSVWSFQHDPKRGPFQEPQKLKSRSCQALLRMGEETNLRPSTERVGPRRASSGDQPPKRDSMADNLGGFFFFFFFF